MIYDSTRGYCYYCGKKIAWKNYGLIGERGCWEVDHYTPKSGGGSDHINNLVPACIPCNREKGVLDGDEYIDYYDQGPGIDWGKVGLVAVGGLILFGLLNNRSSNDR